MVVAVDEGGVFVRVVSTLAIVVELSLCKLALLFKIGIGESSRVRLRVQRWVWTRGATWSERRGWR